MKIGFAEADAWARKSTRTFFEWVRDPANMGRVVSVGLIAAAYGFVFYKFGVIDRLKPYGWYISGAVTVAGCIVAFYKWSHEPKKEEKERQLFSMVSEVHQATRTSVAALLRVLTTDAPKGQIDDVRWHRSEIQQEPWTSSPRQLPPQQKQSRWLFFTIATILCLPLIAIVSYALYFPVQTPPPRPDPPLVLRQPVQPAPAPSPCTTPDGLNRAKIGGGIALQTFILGCQMVAGNQNEQAQAELDKWYRARLNEIGPKCRSSTLLSQCSKVDECLKSYAHEFQTLFGRYSQDYSDFIINEKKLSKCISQKTPDTSRPAPTPSNKISSLDVSSVKSALVSQLESVDKERNLYFIPQQRQTINLNERYSVVVSEFAASGGADCSLLIEDHTSSGVNQKTWDFKSGQTLKPFPNDKVMLRLNKFDAVRKGCVFEIIQNE